MQYKEIQEKFNKVISYSQGIEDPKTDILFSRWLESKRDFIEAMDGKLIWECPNCHNRDRDKMNIARRVCGYISTNDFCQGRTQEIKERVVHLGNE